jgi:succinate dehydrogenase/fumarate reductase flavoprotein subunit
MPDRQFHYDVLIVGGGNAACAAASRGDAL